VQGEETNQMNTFSNDFYTIKYPLNWQQAENPYGDHYIAFSSEADEISLEITTSNMFRDEASEFDVLTEIEQRGMEFEEYIIDQNIGYKIEVEVDEKNRIIFIIQKEEMIFNIMFGCQSEDYNDCKVLIEQIVNSFELNDFESFRASVDNWNKYSIENLEIYYPDNSDIYEGIEEWAKIRVDAFDHIAEYLDVEWKYGLIKIYVFNSKEHGAQYGFPLGFAVSEQNLIFTQDVQSPGHELTHCISYRMNGDRKDSDLLSEGLATYLNMMGNDHHRVSANILQEKDYSIKLLGEDFGLNENAYTLGASFVKYLIDEYGLELFKECYAQNKYNEEESFREFYGKEGNMLLNEWMEYLKTY